MNLITNVKKMLNKPKVFIVDETKEAVNQTKAAIKNLGYHMDGFTDYNKLLYSLHIKKEQPYSMGVIHQNGSAITPEMLCGFIKDIDPKIKLVVYKNNADLKSLVLT